MGKWLALSHYEPDYKVIAFGNDLDVVIKRAIKKGCSNPVMVKVTEEFAGPCWFGNLVVHMNPGVVISKPYVGKKKEAIEIGRRLSESVYGLVKVVEKRKKEKWMD
jgi:hypothetical protein